MKLLLDTHAFIWWDGEPRKLSAAALSAIQDPTNQLLLSTASIWEMMIKEQAGKLSWNIPLEQKVAAHCAVGLEVLPIVERYAYGLLKLPMHHKDPFDRLLIATALSDGLSLITADSRITQYQVPVIW